MEEEADHMSVHANGQVSSGKPESLQQQRNIVRVTVTDKLQEDSPVVVVKKTVSLHTQSITVNGVSSTSKQSMEDTVEMEKVAVLLPVKTPDHPDVPADDEQVEESDHMEPVFDPGVVGGNEKEESSGDATISEGADSVPDSQELKHELDPAEVVIPQKGADEKALDVKEPIDEASAVAVESESRLFHYHPMLEETVEDKNVDDKSAGVEIEAFAPKPEKEEEPETKKTTEPSETGETIEEESPLVVEKRPASLHMEVAFDKEDEKDLIEEASPEIIEKRPVSLHMEQVFCDEGSNEVREPIEEASAVAVESEPRLYDYHPMLEETVDDKNVDDDSVEVEYKPAATKSKEEETETETRETIEEESPLIVEKRPVLLHMEVVFDHKEDDKGPIIEEVLPEVIEKRPLSLHMEQVFNKEGSNEVRGQIEEASTVAVESEPRLYDYHPMLEETVEDENVDKNVDDDSVEVEYEPAATKPEEKKTKTETKETIEEESPLIVENRPVSLHMEAVFDHKEDVKEPIEETPLEIINRRPVSLHMEQVFNKEGSSEVREQIEEASTVVVESEPRLYDYHPMLEETEEDENLDKNVDNDSVEVEYEPAATKPKEEETETETRETIEEESPLILEKRPVSLHMEAVFDHKEDVKEPIEETPLEIINRRPVSLHMEQVFNKEGSSEVREQIEEASTVAVESEPRLYDYHPMLEETVEDENLDKNVDDDSVEVEYEPAATKPEEKKTETETRETVEEKSPLVVEKRPTSLHMEAVFDHKEEDVREEVEEVPPEIIEKRPLSLHMEQVFNEERSTEVREPIEEASTVAVESEPKLFHYHPMLEETAEDKNVDDNTVEVEYEPVAHKAQKEQETETGSTETIKEESPPVVEKRPVSLHMEAVFDPEEDHKVREPLEEVPPVVVEKTPAVSLHEEDVSDEAPEKEVYDEQVTELKEPVTETELVVVDKKRALLQTKVLFDEGSPEDEPLEETKKDSDATIESLLVNVESIIDKPATQCTEENENKRMDIHPSTDKEPIEEGVPVVVEKRPVSLNIGPLFDPEETESEVEGAVPVEDAHSVPQDKGEIVYEVVTDVVEKKPVFFALHGEQPEESQENESADEDESSSVDVLEIPEIEKKKEVEDAVQETIATAVERNAPEFHHELLQAVETDDQKLGETAKETNVQETQVRETEILDDEVRKPVQVQQETQQETQHTEVFTTTITINQKTGEDETTQEMDTKVVQTIYEKKTVEVATESAGSTPNTTTTEETFRSTSFTKLIHQEGRDDEEQLLRHVLRKRLSAPEVLPEKENDGSAPLAASEDRGILESQEQFSFAENSRKKDSTPTKTPVVPGDAPSGTEPYKDVPDEEKLIPDVSGEDVVGGAGSVEKPEEGGDETLPVLLLLRPEEEEKSELEKERKKGKKGGLSSPQCKCCLLM